MDFAPLILTFKLAAVTTLVLLIVAIPLALWLGQTKSPFKSFIETLVSLPLVLPPTVLGFYLLLAFSPNNAVGNWLNEVFGIQLVFTFSGLVIGSVLYSLPFMVQPILSGLAGLSNSMRETAQVLGKSKIEIARRVLLPNIKPAILLGVVLCFAHTIGEFGVVLMIGGSIPGQTKVASIAIFENVEAMNYSAANGHALVLLGVAFVLLLSTYSMANRRMKRKSR